MRNRVAREALGAKIAGFVVEAPVVESGPSFECVWGC